MRGKLIVIEGTDCSGKTTQVDLLIERLEKDSIKVIKYHFPHYESPTGRIIGGPYLGKVNISECWFPEGTAAVNPKVASLYYAADRLYNIKEINNLLDQGYCVFLDRYIPSNMAHQGGKILDSKQRKAMYDWLDTLEYKLLQLPMPDITVLLYMPYEYAKQLKECRTNERPDGHEISEAHLRNAEQAYLELADIYHWTKINCVKDNQIRTIDDINDEVYNRVIDSINIGNNEVRG